MPARKITMPTSLNESLAASQPPNLGTDPSPAASMNSFSSSAREPLASQKPKSNTGITFAAEDKLPKLPIPELENSCKKYLDALKPLQSPSEHAESKVAVEEFLKSEGPELQERLKKYATGKTSYIEQFCESLQPAALLRCYDCGHYSRIVA